MRRWLAAPAAVLILAAVCVAVEAAALTLEALARLAG